MLYLLSPAKSLDYETPLQGQAHTAPLFVKQSKVLIDILREFSPAQIAQLMDLSDKLSTLNAARYQAWSRATEKNARQAVLAFDGDVYSGLQAHTLDTAQLEWAQAHLCILSGLYGVLRPLDLMQPYRLEMGTALHNPAGAGLYAYWSETVTDYLNQRLKKEKSAVVVNLASQEYAKVVNVRRLEAQWIECVFQDYQKGQYKIISFFAKKARGLMARYAIESALTEPAQLQAFDCEGYAFAPDVSTAYKFVFRSNTVASE